MKKIIKLICLILVFCCLMSIFAACVQDEHKKIAVDYAKLNNVDITEIDFTCYAEFDGAHVLMLNCNYADAMSEETVDGVVFHHSQIKTFDVYSKGQFYTLQEAFDGGLLTHDDLVALRDIYNPQYSSGENNENDDEVYSMKISIGNAEFTATLYDTAAAQAFAKSLPMTLDMSELNGNEKYNYLSTTLPTNAERVGNINAGDIMLYGNSCIVLFYKGFSTSYSYTKIGKINDVSGLQQAVGSGNITVTFQTI